MLKSSTAFGYNNGITNIIAVGIFCCFSGLRPTVTSYLRKRHHPYSNSTHEVFCNAKR